MDPLKAAAATAVCLALFWLAFRLTRRLVDLVIAGGYAEERRRLAEEAAQEAAIRTTAANSAANQDPSSAAGIGVPNAVTSSIKGGQGAPAE
ncbi:hypothetical protein MKK69_27440 [Methylobacterium sp. J-026]|uniref:hypothetical protein n=1 Tax=Methylobacterium sp. J-026 TaxID=2836624 RepID=UPI001FBA51E8|nr:hypothetical protein [Methylobacterium sp. J-026]MCJ2137734.1 hypothetical protein [Methylobacterium sp. J-026]